MEGYEIWTDWWRKPTESIKKTTYTFRPIFVIELFFVYLTPHPHADCGSVVPGRLQLAPTTQGVHGPALGPQYPEAQRHLLMFVCPVSLGRGREVKNLSHKNFLRDSALMIIQPCQPSGGGEADAAGALEHFAVEARCCWNVEHLATRVERVLNCQQNCPGISDDKPDQTRPPPLTVGHSIHSPLKSPFFGCWPRGQIDPTEMIFGLSSSWYMPMKADILGCEWSFKQKREQMRRMWCWPHIGMWWWGC